VTIKDVAIGGSPWGRRVGAGAAGPLISAARLRIAALVSAACAVVLIGVSVLVLERSGESHGFALVVSFAVVAVTFAGSLFHVAAMLRWLGVDSAFELLQHRVPGLTGEQVRRSLRSVDRFDELLAPRLLESVSAPSDAAWTAGVSRPMLRGVSQRTLRTVSNAVLVVVAAWATALASLGATGHFPPQWLWVRLWSVAVVAMALGGLLRLATAVRRVQEFRAGYSTVWALLPTRGMAIGFDARRCVDLVDARSGMLLRRAGQAPISRDVYRNRRDQVRQ